MHSILLYTRKVQHPVCYMPTDLQMLLLMSLIPRCSGNDWVKKLSN